MGSLVDIHRFYLRPMAGAIRKVYALEANMNLIYRERMIHGLILRYPECILDEVRPAHELLSPAYRLSYVDLEEVGADMPDTGFLLIPGGSCDLAINHVPLRAWIRDLYARGRPIGAICNGAMVLADAGVLDGKPCTHTAHPSYAKRPRFDALLNAAEPIFARTRFVDEDVVRTGHLVTAKPWAAEAFARVFHEILSEDSSAT